MKELWLFDCAAILTEEKITFYHSSSHQSHQSNPVWSHTLWCGKHTLHTLHMQTVHQGICGAGLWGLWWSLQGLWHSLWGALLQQDKVQGVRKTPVRIWIVQDPLLCNGIIIYLRMGHSPGRKGRRWQCRHWNHLRQYLQSKSGNKESETKHKNITD